MAKTKKTAKKKLPVTGIIAIIAAFAAVVACAVLFLNKWSLELKLNGEETVHVEYGDTYTYTAPTLNGYTATPGEYSGIVPAQNVVLTFTYYVDAVVDAISISVSWGTLDYTVTPGMWNPEKLSYEETLFTPDKTGENTVAVTNTSAATDVVATLNYTMATGYESIDGYFTATDNKSARKNAQMSLTASGGTDVRYVWLEGTIPETMTGGQTAVCRTVKVTVAPKS
jgi:hypothetical protein